MRYDAIMEKHHHLYSLDSDRIEDYFDEDLNQILEDYFSKKHIKDFEIRDIKLQLIGTFKQP
jgi:Fur family transcriptional regulator, peroxide stress response regulator